MASWKVNPIMEWSFDGGDTWEKVTDHGRSSLSINTRRIENVQTMADGHMRRYVVAKKKTFSTGWENLPDKASAFLANGLPGEWIEEKHDDVDGSFLLRLRAGSDRDLTLEDLDGKIFCVMFSDFSKEIVKRGNSFDLWNLDITLEEV